MTNIRRRRTSTTNDYVAIETSVDPSTNPTPEYLSLEKAPEPEYHSLRTLTWEQIEPWQQDNYFIVRGYRPATNSYQKSIKSLAYIHNQSVNIWSHLLGAFAFIASAFAIYLFHNPRLHHATWFDLLLLGQFYLGIVVCFSFSAAFHTFGNHSDAIYHSFLLCDLAGIILLTTTSFYPGVYYGFYCEPRTIRLYWAMITIFGTGAFVVCLVPKFRHGSWRPLRTAMLMSLGLSGIIPMTHAAMQFGISQARRQMGWDWYVGEGFFYVFGALIYAIKVPERWYPGRFDVWGSSHQIFHMCVLFGAASHLIGAVTAMIYNNDPQTKRC